MFSSAAQKPTGFLFGSTNSSTSQNNPGISSGNGSKPGLFGNSQTNGQTTSNALAGGFSFGNNANSKSTPTAASSNFLFSNKPEASTTSSIRGAGSSLFGNNGTSSLFGNNATNQTFGNTQYALNSGSNNFQQQQPQQQSQRTFNNSPYGVSFSLSKSAVGEMPNSLTSNQEAQENYKLKRKRSNSSLEAKPDNEKISLIGRLVDTFKKPSSYSIESVNGLFSSTKSIIDQKKNESNAIINRDIQMTNGLSLNQIPAVKSEYRRLVIRNPRDAFSNFKDIDPNQVILNRFNIEAQSGPSKSVENFQPSLKRGKMSTSNINHSSRSTAPSNDAATLNLNYNHDEIKSQDYQIVEDSEKLKSENGYWCTPSIEELSKLSTSDLVHVENFTAGRKGSGQVMFKYPVDLSEFEGRWDTLLGETIIFNGKILEIYANNAEKPSQGNGLNVPSVIIIENCYPKNYDPASPNGAVLSSFIDQLKSRLGMTFINYNPDNGSYTFSVEHFSIWGVVDEETDDPEIVERFRKQQELEALNEKRKKDLQINVLEKIRKYNNEAIGENYKKQKPDFGLVVPGSWSFQGQNQNQNQNSNETNNNKHDKALKHSNIVTNVVENSFVPDENDVDLSISEDIIEDDSGSQNNPFFGVVQVRAYEPNVEDVDMLALKPKTEFPVSEDWNEQLNLADGFYSVFNKELNQNKNMKLDPDNVNKFLFGKPDGSNLPKEVLEPPINFENLRSYKNFLQEEIEKSVFEKRNNDFPRVKLDDDVSLEISLKSFFDSPDYDCWELLSILYDDHYCSSLFTKKLASYCSNNQEKVSRILNLERRELLCNWLQDLINANVKRGLENQRDPLNNIFYFICTGKLDDAVQYAINTKNNHLSILLTLADSNDPSVCIIAKNQLKEWFNTSSLELIPVPILKIYKLLSGDILSKHYVSHLEGLSWPVVLLLLLKYSDSNKPLASLIKEFVDYENQLVMDQDENNFIYYQIMKMVNSPGAVIPKFPVEFQFLLGKKLGKFIKISNSEFDDIALKFSNKLVKKQLYEEAIYVLSHLNDDLNCKNFITGLINNHINSLGFLTNDNKLSILHKKLHLPLSLLNDCRSIEFVKKGKYYSAVLSLIDAGMISKSHRLLLDKVAPEFIISNKGFDKLEKLLVEFKTLSDYSLGGGLYYKYLQALKISRENNFDQSDELKKLIEELLNNLQLLEETSFNVKVVKTIMAKKLIGLIFDKHLEYNPTQLLGLSLPESEKNYLKAKISCNSIEMK